MVADTGKKQNIYGLVLSVCFCYDCTVPDGDVYAVQGDRYVKSGKSGGDHLCICRVWSGIIGVYVCRFYQMAIPISLEEAAMIDGCTPIQTFFRIVLPVLKPTAITVAILNAMWIWNDYLLPLLVLGSDYQTIPIAVQYLRGGYGSVDMGAMMGMLVLAILPIIVFYLLCQKYIIKGVAAGAVKG